MKSFIVLPILFLMFITGCSSDPIAPPVNEKTGSILFNLDKENAPENVFTVTAYLIRPGYRTISASLNIKTSTTADLSLDSIPVGQWHIKVDAMDQQGVVVYTGDANVTILEGTIVQVSLTLMPVNSGTGSIYIFVSWGNNMPGWIDYPGNPVLSNMQTPGNPDYISEHKIIYDRGKYRMWYNAIYSGPVAYIYYAESLNGVDWMFPLQNPVLSPDPGSWDSKGVAVGGVIKNYDSTYVMFYSGWDGSTQQIGVAFSPDGINWTKKGSPVIQPPPITGGESFFELKIAAQSAIRVNDLYYLYYGMTQDYLNDSLGRMYYLNVATSPDLENWEIHYDIFPDMYMSPVYRGRPAYASVIFQNNSFRMVYQNARELSFQEVYSGDGIYWNESTSMPVIEAGKTNTNWCWRISYPCLVNLENLFAADVVRLYYSGTTYEGKLSMGFCYPDGNSL